jgi:precorrin-6B methylase 2
MSAPGSIISNAINLSKSYAAHAWLNQHGLDFGSLSKWFEYQAYRTKVWFSGYATNAM